MKILIINKLIKKKSKMLTFALYRYKLLILSKNVKKVKTIS